MLALAILLAHAATAAPTEAPAFDLGLHGYTATGGRVVVDGPVMDLGARGGLAMMGWVAPAVGLGIRLDYGSYGLTQWDFPNAFAFAEGQVRIRDRWTVGAGIGTPIAWYDYYCLDDCGGGEMLWEYHHPIGVLTGTYDVEWGGFHMPVSLRAEGSAARWAIGIDLGLGLRFHRRS